MEIIPFDIEEDIQAMQDMMAEELSEIENLDEGQIKELSDSTDVRERYLGDFNPLDELRIGDVQLPIPPQSISVSAMNDSAMEPSEVIRSKTQIPMSGGNTMRQVRISFHINGTEQINGTPKKAIDILGNPIEVMTNSKEVSQKDADPKYIEPTYYINGLRCLLAQFRVSPFLPIDNYKLNNENGIEAVTLQNITVSNVDNFPETLKVECIFMEFNHTVYIDSARPFESIFNWDLFRFNYQRLLEGTNMPYDRGPKLPIINSIAEEEFNFDIVKRESLKEHEEAVEFLSSVPRFVGETTYEHEENDFHSMIEDSKIFSDAEKQYNKYQELKSEMLSMYKGSSHHPFDNYSGEYSFYSLFNELLDVTTNDDRGTVLPIGIAKELPDERFDGYSLLEEYNNWIETTDELNYNEKFFIPFEYIESSYYIDQYSVKYHAFIFNEEKNRPIRSEKTEQIIENGKNQLALNSYFDDVNIDKSAYYDNKISIKTFSIIKDSIIDEGQQNKSDYEQAQTQAGEAHKKYEYNNIDFNNLHVQDVSISYMNDVVTQSISMQTKPAHQYLGSRQIEINVEAIASSEQDIQKLNYLLEHSQEMLKRFQNILDVPVLDFNNSISNLFNLDGVYIKDLSDETIPNYPGARAVHMSMIGYWEAKNSYDSLTTKYRNEATQILDGDTDFQTHSGVSTHDELQGYMELKEKLAKTNLYPDLELPKYNELPKNYFDAFDIHIKDDEYADPDYYALHVDSMFVEEALKVIDDDLYNEGGLDIVDTHGDSSKVSFDDVGTDYSRSDSDIDLQPNDKIGDLDSDDYSLNKNEYDAYPWPSRHFEEEEFRNKASAADHQEFNPWNSVDLDENNALDVIYGLDLLQEVIYNEFGEQHKITLTSTARTPEWGGAENSRHNYDQWSAIDFYVQDMEPNKVMGIIEELEIFTGRGLYLQSGFIHVDARRGLKDSTIARWIQNHEGIIIDSTHKDGPVDSHWNGYLNRFQPREDIGEEEVEQYQRDPDEQEITLSNQTKLILEAGYRLSNKNRDQFNEEQQLQLNGLHDFTTNIIKDIADKAQGFSDNYLDLVNITDHHSSVLVSMIASYWNEKKSGSYIQDDYEAQYYPEEALETNYFIINPWSTQKNNFKIPKRAQKIYEKYRSIIEDSDKISNLDSMYNHYIMQVAIILAAANEEYSKLYDLIDGYDLESVPMDHFDENKILGSSGATTNIFESTHKKDIVIKLILIYSFVYGVDLPDMALNNESFDELQHSVANHQNKLDGPSNAVLNNEETKALGHMMQSIAKDIQDHGSIDIDSFRDYAFLKEGDMLINLRGKEARFKDTFHDMLKYDQRGRLLRAFPTYYLMFIDESDNYFVWRLQDLFYEYQGVKNINIVKDKDNVADVCHLTLSNSKDVLSDATGGHKELDIDHGFFQTILSSINPFSNFNEEKAARALDINSVQLQTGAKIHLRIGYGSAPTDLPTVFNGKITELQLGEQIELVAQDAGIELNKPLTDFGPKETTKNLSGWWQTIGGDDPLSAAKNPTSIFAGMYQYDSGVISWISRRVASAFDSGLQSSVWGKEPKHDFRNFGGFIIPSWWDNNPLIKDRHNLKPYKATNFLELTNKIGDGKHENPLNFEIAQNTYTVRNPDNLNEVNTDSVVEFNLYGKSPWDLMQLLAMSTPGYICETHPFGIDRSTIFFGHPSYDLAYDYGFQGTPTQPVPKMFDLKAQEAYEDYKLETLDEQYAQGVEQLKTFRQMRVYGSYQDIIANNISAVAGFPTSVNPVYSDRSGDVEGDDDTDDAVYLDADIKAEHQLQIDLDTSVNIGNIFRRTSNKWLNNSFFTDNTENAIFEIASSALADNVRDMYQGRLMVMGDPTVKPYDYSYLFDMAEKMNGFFEVGAVVHNINKKQGFTTSIEPEPVVFKNSSGQIDGEYLLWAQSRMEEIYRSHFVLKAMVMSLTGAQGLMSKFTLTDAVLGVTGNVAKKMGNVTVAKAKAINGAVKTLSNLLQNQINSDLTPWKEKAFSAIGKYVEPIRGKISGAMSFLKKSTTGTVSGDLMKVSKLLGSKKASQAAGTGAINAIKSKTFGILSSVLSGASVGVAALTGPVGIAVKMITSWLIVNRVTDWLDSFRRPHRTPLTLMLLNKHGQPFDAGIDGARRAVVGKDVDNAVHNFLFDNPIFNFFAGKDYSEENTARLQDQLEDSANQMDSMVGEQQLDQHMDIYGESEASVRPDMDSLEEVEKRYKKELKNIYDDTVWDEQDSDPLDILFVNADEPEERQVQEDSSTPTDEPSDIDEDDYVDELIQENVDYSEDEPEKRVIEADTNKQQNINEEVEILNMLTDKDNTSFIGDVKVHESLKEIINSVPNLKTHIQNGDITIKGTRPNFVNLDYGHLYNDNYAVQLIMDPDIYGNILINKKQSNKNNISPWQTIATKLNEEGIVSIQDKGNKLHIDLAKKHFASHENTGVNYSNFLNAWIFSNELNNVLDGGNNNEQKN